VGAVLSLDGLAYAVFSSLAGVVLDRNFPPAASLALGTTCLILGYSLLGPAPFLPFLPESVWGVVAGVTVHGYVTNEFTHGKNAQHLPLNSCMCDTFSAWLASWEMKEGRTGWKG